MEANAYVPMHQQFAEQYVEAYAVQTGRMQKSSSTCLLFGAAAGAGLAVLASSASVRSRFAPRKTARSTLPVMKEFDALDESNDTDATDSLIGLIDEWAQEDSARQQERRISLGTQTLAAVAATMISTSGVNVEPFLQSVSAEVPSVTAKKVSPKKLIEVGLRDDADLTVNGIERLTFALAEQLSFEKYGWGDEEAKLLSQELPNATSLKKLFLNGNQIQCDGANALVASIKGGAAPNLKVLNLAGNRGITETDKRALRESRKGLEVSVVPTRIRPTLASTSGLTMANS
jgi:hypothetical protein